MPVLPPEMTDSEAHARELRLLAAVRRVTSMENPSLYVHLEATFGADSVPSYDAVVRALRPNPSKSVDEAEVAKVRQLGAFFVELGSFLLGTDSDPAASA